MINNNSKIDIEKEVIQLKMAQSNTRHFEYFYNQYYEKVFRFVYQRMDSKADAIDLTQQTFIKALKNINNFEHKGIRIISWFFRIALNEVNQFYRNKNKKRVINITSIIENTLIEELETDNSLMRKEELVEHLKKLTKEEFSLIEMRFFEEKSFKIIGDILSITENNAKVKTYRIISKLKTLFTKNVAL